MQDSRKMKIQATDSKAPVTVHPAFQGMRSTLIGIGVNILLAGGKAVAGVLGHSYALVADAIESGADVFSSLLVYLGLKVAVKPPDEDHPLGHGKAEPLAGMAVALFLFGAAFNIARQSVIQIRTPHVMPAPWTLPVLIGVLLVKEAMYRFVMGVGAESGSSAVKGDALHHRSDALTSVAAFIGISVALIGHHFDPDPRWSSADDWAALSASFVIAYNGWGILKGALRELTDAMPDRSIEEEIRRVALTIPGVANLDKCIVRKMGFDYVVDLDVRVDRDMPVHEAHDIAHRVQDALRAKVAGGRVIRAVIHIEPTLPH
jgi:cation diffusion facilitator family transporter